MSSSRSTATPRTPGGGRSRRIAAATRELAAAGYLGLRVTWRQLTQARAALIARTAGALAVRDAGTWAA